MWRRGREENREEGKGKWEEGKRGKKRRVGMRGGEGKSRAEES